MRSFSCFVLFCSLLLLAAPGSAQSFTITGPTTGATDELLEFEATASGCSPTQGQYFWQVDGGSVAGVANNDSILITWSTPGEKTINVSNFDCLGGSGSANVTITDQGRITIGADNFNVDETDGQVQISVLRQGGSNGAAQVSYATSNGSAVSNSDYNGTSGTLNWADGDNSNRLVAVPLVDDAVFEEDETFFFTLSDVSGAGFGSVLEASINITDNDPPPGDVVEFEEVLFEGTEGGGSVTVVLRRSGQTAGAISVDLASANNSATAPADFAAVNTTVSWGPTDVTNKTVQIPIVDDNEEEGTEIADLVLSNPQPENDVFIGDNDLAQLIIIDNDVTAGSLSFTSTVVTANEASGTATLQVQRTGGSTGAVQASISPTQGTATLGDDYSVNTQTVSFADGDTTPKQVNIGLIDDDAQEGLETVDFALSVDSGDAVVGSPGVSTLRIEDDDAGPPDSLRFTATQTSVEESAGAIQLTAERVGDFIGPASLTVDLENQTGTVGVDVTAAAILLQWANGEGGARAFTINVIDDETRESVETIGLVLSNPEGAVLGSPSEATLRIIDNDSGFLDFTPTTLALSEPNGSAIISVQRVGPTAEPASADLMVSGSAEQGVDFSLSATSLSWGAGEGGERQITVDVLDDDVADPSETVELLLVNVQGAVARDDRATITIQDDDFELPTARFQTTDALEGPRTARRLREKNRDDILQIWRQSDDQLFYRWSGTSAVIDLGLGSRIMPDVAFDRFGKLWTATSSAQGQLLLSCLDLDQDPSQGCGQLDVGNPQTATALQLSVSLDGLLAIAWIENSSAYLRIFGIDGQPRSEVTELGAADQIDLATDALGTVAISWLNQVTGELSLMTLRDDGSTIAAESPLNSSVPSATTTGAAIGFNGEGQLHLATSERLGNFDQPLQLRTFTRALEPALPTLELGVEARGVELSVNNGGDLALAYGSATPSSGGAVSLVAEGSVQRSSFPLEGDLRAPTLTDADLLQFTRVTAIAGSEAENFEVFEFSIPVAAGECGPDSPTATDPICLTEERFEVSVQWQDYEGGTGGGTGLSITTDSGYHWFFSDTNVETVIKVLDACIVNNRFWMFDTGLTDTEAFLVVDDVLSGVTRSFFNPLGSAFEPFRENDAFATCDVGTTSATRAFSPEQRAELAAAMDVSNPAADALHHARTQTAVEAEETCLEDQDTLCLLDGRFRVEVQFATLQGSTGTGETVVLTADTGAFTFFDRTNIEIVIKIIDACTFNNRLWVFAGGLTDVETRMVVTDTATGTQNVYENPLGQGFIPIRDIMAFDTCDAP